MMACAISVLCCAPGRRATKCVIREADGEAMGSFRLRVRPDSTRPHDFGLARVNADGYLETLDDLDWNEDGQSCALRPGEYALLVPTRKTNETVVELRPFQIRPQTETSLDFPETTP